jgi:hypothetical protein
MPRSRRTAHPRQIQFKIEASRSDLKVGDRVTPETIVGVDWDTGKCVAAALHGEVVGVTFLGGEHAFLVFIRPDF